MKGLQELLLNKCFERASGSVGFGTELDEATRVWRPCPNRLLFTSIIYIALNIAIYEYKYSLHCMNIALLLC